MATGQADGSVRVDIIFKTEQAKKQWEDFEKYTIKSANSLQNQVERINKKKSGLIIDKKQINQDIKSLSSKMKEIEDEYSNFAKRATELGGTYQQNLDAFTSGDPKYKKYVEIMADLKQKRIEINRELRIENEELEKVMTAYDIVLENQELQKNKQLENKLQLQQINDEYKKMQISQEVDKEIAKTTAKDTGEIEKNVKNTTKGTKTLNKDSKSIERSTHKTKGHTQSFTNSISKGVKQLLRYSLALLGVRSAMTGLRQVLSAYMNSDAQEAKQLKKDLESIKLSLGNALAPLARTILNIFYKILGVVGALVKAFSGIDIFAKKTANSTKDTANNVKNTLASFDKIDVLEQDTGADDGDITPTDISSIEQQYEKLAMNIKNTFETLLEPIKRAWDVEGKSLLESIQKSFNNLKSLTITIGSSLFEVWENGTGQQSVETILRILKEIVTIIGNIAKAFENAWKKNNTGIQIVQNLWNAFNNLLGIVEAILKVIDEFTKSKEFQGVLEIILGAVQKISEWLNKITKAVKGWLEGRGGQTLKKFLDLISKLVSHFALTHQWIGKIIDVVTDNLTPLLNLISDLLDPIIDTAEYLIEILDALISLDFDRAKRASEDYYKKMSKNFENLTNDVKGFTKDMQDTVVSSSGIIHAGAGKNFDDTKKEISDSMKNARDITVKMFDEMQNVANVDGKNIENNTRTAFTNVKNTITTEMNNAKNNSIHAMEGLKNGVNQATLSLQDNIRNPYKNIKETISNEFNNAKNNSMNAMQELKEGTLRRSNDIKVSINEPYISIKDVITNSFMKAKDNAINSMNEMKNGINRKSTEIKNDIVSPFNKIKEDITNALNGVEKNGVTAFDTMKNKIKESLQGIANAHRDTLNAMNNKTPYNQIITKFEGVANNTRKGFKEAYATVIGILGKLGVATIDISNLNNNVNFPKLAKGGIVTQMTPAIIGEARKGSRVTIRKQYRMD